MKKDLDEFIKSVSKEIDFTGTISSLENVKKVNIIPFGIKTVDDITGVGGIARGRVTEIYGKEAAGKTSLCLRLVAEAQKMGIKSAYIDVELAIDKSLATMMGVDTSSLMLVRPTTGEETFELIEALSESGCGLIVVDSVASMVPSTELENDYDQDTMALQARMISKGLRKVIGTILKNDTALVFVNQLRSTVSRMPNAPQTTTSGGLAIKYYATHRISIVRTGWVGTKEKSDGMYVKVSIDKNRLARPNLSTEVSFIYGKGFDVDEDLFNFYLESGRITRTGNTYYEEDKKIGNKEETIKYIKNEKQS